MELLGGNHMNKFFTTSDQKINELIFPLEPIFFWSRLYEYPFALQYAKGTVLDAACGLEHPFKFALDKKADVYACDLYYSPEKLNEAVKRQFHAEVPKNKITFTQSDISNLPYENNKFDTIFCISVLEHLNTDTLIKSLEEFYRTLKYDGKLVLTVDYPMIEPHILLRVAQDIGFTIGEYDYTIPDNAIYSDAWGVRIKCFSMVLQRGD